MTRRFEYTDAKSNKFWEITVHLCDVTVQYGRIGTDGQRRIKTYKTIGEAKSAAEKQEAEKVKVGYRLVEHSSAAATKARRRKPASNADAKPTCGTDRFAWNARTTRWREVLLLALEEGRTTLEHILPLYREDPAVVRAAVKGGFKPPAPLEEIDFATHALRAIIESESSLWTEGDRTLFGLREDTGWSFDRVPGMTPDAFRPDQGKHGAENAREIISAYPNLFSLGDPRILPENLRSDADFIGPFLLCYGMGYLPQASPQVRAEPDILRAVFTESLFDDLRQPVLNGILECLDACLLDRSAGLRGPATMSPGEKRTFENDGLPVDVYCLAQQQERGQGAGTVVLTSLYLACYESEEYGMHDDVAALQVRSELRGKGKKRHWAVLSSAMHTPFNNLLWNESKLDFFSPADDESDDEFDFEDQEN